MFNEDGGRERYGVTIMWMVLCLTLLVSISKLYSHLIKGQGTCSSDLNKVRNTYILLK